MDVKITGDWVIRGGQCQHQHKLLNEQGNNNNRTSKRRGRGGRERGRGGERGERERRERGRERGRRSDTVIVLRCKKTTDVSEDYF